MAIRDQIISEQRNVIKNLWNVVEYSGVDKDIILETAQNEGMSSVTVSHSGRSLLQGIRMDLYLQSANRAPTVGASELLTLLNSEKLGQMTLRPQKRGVRSRSPSITISESGREYDYPSQRSPIEDLLPKDNSKNERETGTKLAIGVYNVRSPVRGRLREDRCIEGQRKSRSADSSRNKEPLMLRGASFAHPIAVHGR